MIRAALILPLSLAACAAAPEGGWPSLALRPGEAQPLVARPAAGTVVASAGTGAASAASAAAADPAPAPAAARDATARLASLERDVAEYDKRLHAQIDETKASAARTGEDAAATAELERTRLDRLGSQVEDLREHFNDLAGDLARQAAAGADVTATLARVGAGIDRVEALRAEQAAARR